MGWNPGWHLNAAGRAQAERLAARLANLPIRAIYTSPLERAIETAVAIARPHALEPERDGELGEVRFGAWEGLAIAELEQRADFRRYNQFRSGIRPPGGELMIEVQGRMVRETVRLAERHNGETVALVSHGDPLRVLLAYCLGIPLDLLLRFEVGTASVSVVEMAEWGPRVMHLNLTEAL
jgi:probable phosphoglycerate mutase